MPVPDAAWRAATRQFAGFTLDDSGTLEEMRRLKRDSAYVADPHTAVGTAAARAHPGAREVPIIIAATAHPAKFPDAVRQALGEAPALPPHLADLYDRPERFSVLPNELPGIEAFVRAHARRNA